MPAGWAEAQGPVIPYRPLDDYVAAAKAALPGLDPRTVRLPFGPDEPVVVEGFAGDPLVRERANEVWLDPVDAGVVKVQRSADMTALHYVTELADPLHFGTFGGLPTKLLWFAGGLGLSGLALTGAWLAWRRLRTRAPTPVQLLTLLPLGAVLLGGWSYVREQRGGDAFARARTLPALSADGYRVAPTLELDGRGVPTGRLQATVASDSGGLNFAEARVSACGRSSAAAIDYAGWAAMLDGQLDRAAFPSCRGISIEFGYRDGRRRRFDWSLS
jgi:hypothetical protein